MELRYGLRHPCDKCLNLSTFHRLSDRPAFSCARCGHHVYPCAGTIFQDTRTSLLMWFYAIYLFVATRHGVSGKELQRALGVTYKTAWRVGQQIRKLMIKAEDFAMLQGLARTAELGTHFGTSNAKAVMTAAVNTSTRSSARARAFLSLAR
jgi:hypothetical protein